MTPFELGAVAHVLDELSPRSTYLEIGARRGDSLAWFTRRFPKGSQAIAVDLPGGPWGAPGTDAPLRDRAAELRAEGYHVELFFGDSKNTSTIQQVRAFLAGGQVDVLLIDGDHRPLGVAADVNNYSPLVRPGGIVIFHDCGQVRGAECRDDSNRTMCGVRGVFEWFAYGRRRLIVQEHWGLGVVWL